MHGGIYLPQRSQRARRKKSGFENGLSDAITTEAFLNSQCRVVFLNFVFCILRVLCVSVVKKSLAVCYSIAPRQFGRPDLWRNLLQTVYNRSVELALRFGWGLYGN
jgi:hypothetical protein